MQFQVFVICLISIILAASGFPNPEIGRGDNLDLAYSSWEPAEGESKDLPPIIFLHGMTGSKENWDEMAPRLVKETGRKAYALDQRDHGDSPRTGNPSTSAMTEDVIDFMDRNNIPKAALVGHSLGGRVSMSLALTHPEKIEKVAIEDISTATFPPKLVNMMVSLLTILQKAIEMVPSGVDEMQAKRFIAEYLLNLMPNIWEGDENLSSDYYLGDLPIFYLNSTREISDKDLNNILIKKENGRYVWKANIEAIKKSMKEGKFSEIPEGSYDGDTLIIYGGKSFLNVKADEEDIKKHFPKALLVLVAAAGHDIHGRFPDEFFEEVSKFINA